MRPTFLDSVRVAQETAPEAIDKLKRQKLQLEVEIHALKWQKDNASKEWLEVAQKAIADVEEQLQLLKAAYENEKKCGNKSTQVHWRINELAAKADEMESIRKKVLRTWKDLLILNSHPVRSRCHFRQE